MSSKKFIVCADLMEGGADYSLRGYCGCLDSEDGKSTVTYLDTRSLTPGDLVAHQEDEWIIGNFATLLGTEALDMFRDLKIKYSIFHFDYLFCPHRNIEYHTHLTGAPPVYGAQMAHVDKFYAGARASFFMSEVQMENYLGFLHLIEREKCHVLGSLLSQQDLELIEEYKDLPKSNLYGVYAQDTWQKGKESSIAWCEKNNKAYEIIPKAPREEFLRKLATYKGLVFMPNGGDTAPRLVIEARLLGLDLFINSNVQHCKEEWFCGDRSGVIEHLRGLPEKFIKLINENKSISRPSVV